MKPPKQCSLILCPFEWQGSTQRECYWLLLEKQNVVVNKIKEKKSGKCIFKK